MAVEEEAIVEIENAFEQLECRYDGYYYNLIEVTKQALKKQMPKKPEEKMYLQAAELYVGKCPNCESGMNSKMNYCDNCGQRLNWGGEENDD